MSPRVLVLVALTACGRFGFDPVNGAGGDDAGNGSGSGSGDVLAGCLSPGYGDGFDEIQPCAQFGNSMVVNGGMNVSNSQLTITPNANSQTSIGCNRSSATFTRPGTFVEISQILPQPGQTLLGITSSVDNAGFVAFMGLLAYTDTSGADVAQPYDPIADRWWRIRPISTGTIAEVSANGTAWTTFARSSLMLGSPVTIALYAQTDTNDPTPGTAVIQGIDVCP
ncbi:MAG: hypothetical protein ABI591_22645 [Kofleriaceae bacterium]